MGLGMDGDGDVVFDYFVRTGFLSDVWKRREGEMVRMIFWF